MMEDYLYRPLKSHKTFAPFEKNCKTAFRKHVITVVFPKHLKDACYQAFSERFAALLEEKVEIPIDAGRPLKD